MNQIVENIVEIRDENMLFKALKIAKNLGFDKEITNNAFNQTRMLHIFCDTHEDAVALLSLIEE